MKSASDYFGVLGIAAQVRRALEASRELETERASGGLDYKTYLPRSSKAR